MSCTHSDEAAFLNSAPLSRVTSPSELGEIWTALVETNLLALDQPISDVRVLLKMCTGAASSILEDPRLRMTLARTCPVEAAPAGGPLAARWPTQIVSSAINSAPEVTLFTEAWLMWRCRNRCTNAARIIPTHPVQAIFEEARARAVNLYPNLAPFLTVQAANMQRIASTVGSEMAKLVLPIEMLTFPQEDFEDMMDTTMIALYLFGTPAEREMAFCERLPKVLEHFTEVKSVLEPKAGCYISSGALGGFLKQLTTIHMSGDHDPWCTNTLSALDVLCKEANDSLIVEADPPVDVSSKLLYHEQHLHRIQQVKKAELEAQDGTGVSRVGGVQAVEFRTAS